MASRRDELNAYTFAKKRLVAAFLQPTPSGTEEGAPRPLRAVLPGVIIGVVIMAGFGAWGMFKPKAPEGWDAPGEKVIIGSESTTRYVVLKTDGKKQLHPVLNLASAKLLLDPDRFEIVEVDEKVLDDGDIPHGATLGIPYAPDRLPDDGEATTPKRWAVCTRPGAGGTVEKAAFVLSDRDKGRVDGKNRLRGGEVMYVEGPDSQRYIVDRAGKAFPVADDPKLLRTVVGQTKPQRVGADWLKTVRTGDTVGFPEMPPNLGADAGVGGGLPPAAARVGTVLRATSGGSAQHYVVLEGEVRPVSDFMAQLLLNAPEATELGQHGKATEVSAGAFEASGEEYRASRDWPEEIARTVNGDGDRETLCNVLRDVDEEGDLTLSTWAADAYPATLPNGATSAYVSPGSGLLFRQVKGDDLSSGGVFLVTDTGLRYAVQANTDSGEDASGIGSDGEKDEQSATSDGNRAAIRLGYQDAQPVPVPASWSQFLPTGPRLSTSAAKQPQGS
ncbi:type VII secretion protein EccB [Streptomyces sp. JJ36]|uniref:type VII secretion protein EccB n=1 Tax=Streptomyces sp. JJ36 TaxID=2736645 RepID=UPI001F01F54A|nr:type VII secretion protein EccB [Streptomyces sp. JJ36]MCF6524914.1 type VII secretion protein EccB [Streptomyces sp. JJ36]